MYMDNQMPGERSKVKNELRVYGRRTTVVKRLKESRFHNFNSKFKSPFFHYFFLSLTRARVLADAVLLPAAG